MKLSLLAFMLINTAYAGDPYCNNTTHVTAPGDYYASASDCVISIEKTVFEPTTVWLPSDTNDGDFFMVYDNTPYSLDGCDNYGTEQDPLFICSPAGVTVQSVDSGSGVTVDTGESVTMVGEYYQDSPTRQDAQFSLNGTNWDTTYGYH